MIALARASCQTGQGAFCCPLSPRAGQAYHAREALGRGLGHENLRGGRRRAFCAIAPCASRVWESAGDRLHFWRGKSAGCMGNAFAARGLGDDFFRKRTGDWREKRGCVAARGIFLRENACLTAEGALVAAASRAPFALLGSVCLVVGYGRIGAALVDRLVGLGAKPWCIRAVPKGACAPWRAAHRLWNCCRKRLRRQILSFPRRRICFLQKMFCNTRARMRGLWISLLRRTASIWRRRQEMGLEAWRESGVRAAIAQIARRKRWNGR